MQQTFQTVFEIGLKTFPWFSALRPIFFLFCGILMLLFSKKSRLFKACGFIVVCVAASFTAVTSVAQTSNYFSAVRGYRSGKSKIVVGTVENFQAPPSLGAAPETFRVEDTHFSYDVLRDTACFRNLPPSNPPVKAGLAVRIYYTNDCIQRVDVSR